MRMVTALFAFMGVLASAAAHEQSDTPGTIFRIGVFDRASGEFMSGEPNHPVTYIVGQSQASHDWYSTQAVEFSSASGVLNASLSNAPRAIQFNVASVSAAAYQLHLSLLVETACVPALRVTVNGSVGLFYLHPQLDWNMGDGIAAFSTIYSHADLQFDLPRRFLRTGTNTLTLQPVEQEDEPIADAFIAYDAIELDAVSQPFPEMPLIEPTIFYKKGAEGMRETVDAFVPAETKIRRGSTSLVIGGHSYQQPLSEGLDFGEQRLEFEVPEFSAPAQARLTWGSRGEWRHFEQTIQPAKKWTVLLVPHIHLDVGFTDYRGKVAAAQSRAIDEALDLIAKHPEFRFTLDGEWPLQQFMATAAPAEQQRAIAAIRKQDLLVPAQYANLVTGFPTAETLIRSLYSSAAFSLGYGTPFNYANITDVPSYTWSYASILASSGIHDFLGASDNFRGPVLVPQGRLNERSPFWWEGPDGQKVLFWDSRGYGELKVVFGKTSQVNAGHDMLPVVLQQYENPQYHADETILFGSQGENSDLYPQQADLAERWNRIYAYPRLAYSGVHDAMESIAKQFGPTIATVRGDGGPYWEDGIASDAYYAAVERENERRALSAEKLATLMSLINPRLTPNRSELHRMWDDMVLMDGHTWTGKHSISDPQSQEVVEQLAMKDQYAVDARKLVNRVMDNSMARIVDSIKGSVGSLFVFNPLNWKRSGLVSTDINKGAEIVDAETGKVVPVQVAQTGHLLEQVNFIAADVPALGYRRFELRPASSPMPVERTIQDADHTTVMESPYYRVTLDPQTGAIRSIYDKQLNRELVDAESPYRCGQYLYVRGGDWPDNRILQYRAQYPKPELQVDGARGGHLVSLTRAPYGWVARMESSDIDTPAITTEIRLFEHEKKIELILDLEKNKVYSKEAVYFAFPFAMMHPQFRYEIQTGSVNPAEDMYTGAGHEWFSVQHWVSVQEDGAAVTVLPLDAPLVTLGDINRGAWPDHFGERRGTIFSYVMNNYWSTNYSAGQGGRFRFRYVITSAPSIRPAELDRMGWEEMTPFETDEVILQDRSIPHPNPLSDDAASFIDVEDSHVFMETWKAAEDGHGTILRFLDLDGSARTVTVHTSLLHIREVWLTDAMEKNEKKLQLAGNNGFEFPIGPHQIVTVRVLGDSVLSPPVP